MSDSDNFQVKVEAEVYPTEDLGKVRRTLLNLFPDLNFEVKQSDSFKKILAGNSSDPLNAQHSIEPASSR